ncbi:MAG: bifunctional [glutamine synthetase] adenylyltransferase/[glutamine synthetase]-adenylyl-L-tyrosine phosphorylase, partial [Bifidobacteriaceae bacterium]|nr:bifunctional [glutamine synthetase] adenylyltransferase/[glutamine synthetase]-adenylyl-L-tyrosine phosphorylase [Bifidobacteriaceae bacterium]
VKREIRHLHMDIYYRPMLPISAQADTDPLTLDQNAIIDRFESIGFMDAQSAMRHVEALTNGISRSARINRILLPAVLQWLGQGQNPDMGLLFWRNLEDNFKEESEYLGFLRDSPSAAQRLCHVLSNSRFLGDALNKSVESVTWLGHDELIQARSLESLQTQYNTLVDRSLSMSDFANLVRAMRRREIERIGLGWMNHVIDDTQALQGMSDVTDVILQSTLHWCIRMWCEEHDTEFDNAPAHITIIGLGRYGGCEMNFSSDADAMIVYRPNNASDDHAREFAKTVIDNVRTILQGSISLETKIELDLDLRPEGKNGPLVRSYVSCESYYFSWASTWEYQALLRARYVAGDEKLGEDFLNNIANKLRYPEQPLTSVQISDIRKLKARMESERLPRGVRRERHIKLGKGGLSDVEWCVQLLQLQHAHEFESLRVQSTLPALRSLQEQDFISEKEAQILEDAWKLCTGARNGSYLWSGRVNQADILPDDAYNLGGIAVYVGYDAHQGFVFENDIMALMRQCRDVFDRVFYGC